MYLMEHTNAFTFTIYIYHLTSFPNEGGGRRRGWGRYAQGKARLSNGEEPAPTDVITMAKIRFKSHHFSLHLFRRVGQAQLSNCNPPLTLHEIAQCGVEKLQVVVIISALAFARGR